MSRSIHELLKEALHHFDAATDYAKLPDHESPLVLDAISMRLFAGLEALTRLPAELTGRLFSEEGPDMRGLRHRIAHGYGAINLTRVRETVLGDLPDAVEAIRVELDRHR